MLVASTGRPARRGDSLPSTRDTRTRGPATQPLACASRRAIDVRITDTNGLSAMGQPAGVRGPNSPISPKASNRQRPERVAACLGISFQTTCGTEFPTFPSKRKLSRSGQNSFSPIFLFTCCASPRSKRTMPPNGNITMFSCNRLRAARDGRGSVATCRRCAFSPPFPRKWA